MMKVAGIYKITSPSGKIYIGQSWTIQQRWKWHKNEKAYNGPLQKSFNKYGYDAHAFEIIHELPSDVDQAVLDEYEILYIELYKSCNLKLLNVAPGGLGGRGYRHREEDKKRMSEIAKKRGITQEEITRMHKANTGRALSEERKQKISISLTGQKFTEERCKNLSNALKGRSANSGSFVFGNSPSVKLTPDQVIEIRNKYVPFKYGYVSLGREYGVDKKTIQNIIKGINWAHI
jgi:group I intron endonuclease